MKEAVGHLKKAKDILSVGPLDFYLLKLFEHSEALLTRFAPLKLGDKAVIVQKINCKNGWAGRERTLAIGATGAIGKVDYEADSGGFVFDFVPDVEWWRDSAGVEHKSENPHSYLLGEKYLSKIGV